MALQKQFHAVAQILGKVFVNYQTLTGLRAILVGGAAVSIYTQGKYTSGDFDIIAGYKNVFDLVMKNHGFKNEDHPGYLMGGWYHPDYLNIGVQLVSGPLFNGHSNPAKIRMITIGDGYLNVAAIEDLIADRLGQFAATNDKSQLQQAKWLAQIPNLDMDYLAKRIDQEHGDISLLNFQEKPSEK